MKKHGVSAFRLLLCASALAGLLVPLSVIAQSSADSNHAHLKNVGANSDRIDSLFHRTLIASNPEVASRRLALLAAEARARAAGRRSAAALTAEAEEVPGGFDLPNAGSLRLDVEQEFLGGSLRSAQKSAAASEIEIARASINVTERRLFAGLERDLIRLSGWSAISRRLAAEDDLFSSAEASIRGRFAAGDARYVDILRLRTERLRVQSERAAALTEAAAARIAILGIFSAGGTTGDVIEALASVGRAEPQFALIAIPPVDSLLSISGARHISQARVARAGALRRLRRAEQSRRITASVGAQRFQTESGRYSFGPALTFSTTLPFTARKTNEARTQAADLELGAEEAEQRSHVASLRIAISVAHERYEAARNRLSVYEAALLRGAREERESALASFRSGELSLTELLDFERALARAEVDRIRARISAAEALGDVYDALDEPDHNARRPNNDG